MIDDTAVESSTENEMERDSSPEIQSSFTWEPLSKKLPNQQMANKFAKLEQAEVLHCTISIGMCI